MRALATLCYKVEAMCNCAGRPDIVDAPLMRHIFTADNGIWKKLSALGLISSIPFKC